MATVLFFLRFLFLYVAAVAVAFLLPMPQLSSFLAQPACCSNANHAPTARHSPTTHVVVLCCRAVQQPHDGHEVSAVLDTLAMNLNVNGNCRPQTLSLKETKIMMEYLLFLFLNLILNLFSNSIILIIKVLLNLRH